VLLLCCASAGASTQCPRDVHLPRLHPGRSRHGSTRRVGKVLTIRGSQQAGLRGRGYVNASVPKGARQGLRDVFVKMKGDGHRSGSLLQRLPAQLRAQGRRMIAAELFHIYVIRSHLALYFRNVIEVICERAVHVTQSEGWYLRHDFVRSHALMLVPDNDILHLHPVTRNPSSATAGAGGLDDSFVGRSLHRGRRSDVRSG
jgi:hypothetical protein